MVRKYQPKVATIGISSDDMGFGPVLMECVTNLPITEDCYYAKPDGLAQLGKIINENYGDQVAFYTAPKKASPGTDFYAIGYPQFIRDDKLFCAEIAKSLNQNERTMIRRAVTALNETICNAAATVGIEYLVDTCEFIAPSGFDAGGDGLDDSRDLDQAASVGASVAISSPLASTKLINEPSAASSLCVSRVISCDQGNKLIYVLKDSFSPSLMANSEKPNINSSLIVLMFSFILILLISSILYVQSRSRLS